MMLTSLVRASLEGAVLVAGIWIAGRLWPRLSARTLALLWWCAAAKFLLALVWVAPLELRILPVPQAGSVTALIVPTSPSGPESTSRTVVRLEESARTEAGIGWHPVLLALWMTGAALAMIVSIRRWRVTAQLVGRSTPAAEDIARIAAETAAAIGLKRAPPVRTSNDVNTPFVAGALRPVVVVPADRFAALSTGEKRMALCHELAHVKRADLWLGCVPALAERLFFFHPLVRLAAREYAVCREAACDAAVIDALDTSPREYGRLLLALGVTPGRMAVAAAGAPWSFSTLKRRITMLGEPSNHSWKGRASAAAVLMVAVAAIVPFRLSARPQPGVEQASLGPRRTPLEILTTPAGRSERPGQREPKQREMNYVLFLDDHHTNMSGSTRDIETAGRHRRNGERLLWFRQAGREYVVRDASVIDQVVNLWAPVNVIGAEQGQVGARQGEIGARQGEIGLRQGRVGTEQGVIGAKQGAIGERQGQLAAREAAVRTDPERRSIDAEHRRLDEEMRVLDRQMQELDAKMRDLDKPMRDLDEQMRVLDREMQALDVKMRTAVTQAETEMLTLMNKSIANGVAVSVK
jgi:beta-lactamase regulating signal transducer with metallopeptidase domain